MKTGQHIQIRTDLDEFDYTNSNYDLRGMHGTIVGIEHAENAGGGGEAFYRIALDSVPLGAEDHHLIASIDEIA